MMTSGSTNQYHCSRVFHRSDVYHEAHFRTCPRTNIALRQHDTERVDNFRPSHTWVCTRHLKGAHLMPEIVLCLTGSELACPPRQILHL